MARHPQRPSDHGWDALIQLVVGGVAGLVVYVAVLLVLRTPELSWHCPTATRRCSGTHRCRRPIAPEIAEADQILQAGGQCNADIAERPSPA